MNFSGLLSRMLVLLVFICVGVLCSKLRIIDEKGSACINQLVLYICGPLLIIKSVQNVQFDLGIRDILLLIAYSVILMILAIAVGVVSSRTLCANKPLRGVFSLVTAFGNVFFMGVPVVSALYGDNAVFLLSICAIPFNLFLFSIGIYLLLGSAGQKIPWRKMLINPSLFATFIALALFFSRIELPSTAQDILGYLSQMVVPLSMILIGASLGRMSVTRIFGSGLSYVVCVIKLILMPLVIFAVFRLFVNDPQILGLLTVVAAMPSASISPILCAEYGGDSNFASCSVFLTTLASIVTIPLMVWLLVGR